MAESSRIVPTGPTIRAQAKASKSKTSGRGDGDREVVKASLASPLTVPLPNIPRHLQRTLLHALPQILPSEIADYHVSRQRCHRSEKRGRAKDVLKAGREATKATPDQAAGGSGEGGERVDSTTEETASEKTKRKRAAASSDDRSRPSKKPKAAPPGPMTGRPTAPEILQHLVLGINEVLKSLERQIGDLRMRIMQMGDALNGQLKNPPPPQSLPETASGLLPSAPSDVNLSAPVPSLPAAPSPSTGKGGPSSGKPVQWIVIPLGSINPQSLVSPIPQYCATYNTLVFQYTHLAKICRTRLPSAKLDAVLGEELGEVRIVPLGKVEGEMAEMVGLRRLACVGVRASHPSIATLSGLLPVSVLQPPRLSLTLPLPTSALHIYNGITNSSPPDPLPTVAPTSSSAPAAAPSAGKKAPPKPAKASAGATSPFIHYAPLHVKGITTTIPADGNARKAKRMEEVRAKRREVKERKRLGKMGKKEAAKVHEAARAGIVA